MQGMDWKPDKADRLPLYLQIVMYMKEKITSGEWPVGSRLPTQRALARQLGVNRSTVVTALDELKAQGLIETKAGSGTRVSGNVWSVLNAAAPPDWLHYVRKGEYPPNLPTVQEINAYEPDEQYIRLGTGELSPDLLPAKQMEEVLSGLQGRIRDLGYSPPQGLSVLRRAISRHLGEKGIEASPDAILVVSGALQALQLISGGILHHGSTVLLEKPSYLYSLPLFQRSGMRLAGIPMDEEGIDPEALARQKRMQNGALLYTIASYHNPTGTLMSEARRKKILEICERERLPILEDDVYGELWLDEPGPLPLKAQDPNGQVLYLGSLSKTLSPGLRIGWIVGPQPVIERLADIKMQTDYGSSVLSQLAAAEWLTGERYAVHLQKVRQALRERRNLMESLLRRWFADLADWQTPRGGFYIWLRLRGSISLRTLFGRALEEGILLNPGYIYEPQDSCHLRLSYAYTGAEKMEEAMYRLSRLIRELARP